MTHPRRTILTTLLPLLALAVVAPVLLFAAPKQPKKTNGEYRVKVAGHYTGTGTAEVKKKKVTIKAQIRAEGGAAGQLACSGLKLDGNHFEGIGDFQGVKFVVRGRLDGYADDKTFRGARILCTYLDDSGHAGRIVGVLDAAAASGSGDDDDDD